MTIKFFGASSPRITLCNLLCQANYRPSSESSTFTCCFHDEKVTWLHNLQLYGLSLCLQSSAPLLSRLGSFFWIICGDDSRHCCAPVLLVTDDGATSIPISECFWCLRELLRAVEPTTASFDTESLLTLEEGCCCTELEVTEMDACRGRFLPAAEPSLLLFVCDPPFTLFTEAPASPFRFLHILEGDCDGTLLLPFCTMW